MQIEVCKFGGSSLASPEKIKRVADVIKQHSPYTIVVLSAMQGETAKLLDLAHQMTAKPAGTELDFLLSTGEQVAVSLLAIYLNSIGCPAVALDASKISLVGVGAPQRAVMQSLDKSIINGYLQQGVIPVVTGFQVVLPDGNVATMERGGSDTTAVGIAAAFSAKCYIYSDVPGVYSADPAVIDSAHHWSNLSYDDMLLLSAVGAKVLQVRAIELAKKHRVSIVLREAFANNDKQTVINEDQAMSGFFGIAISNDKFLVKISNSDIGQLASCGVVFDELFGEDAMHVGVIAAKSLPLLQQVLTDVEVSPLLAKLSLVGFKGHYKPNLLSKMLACLAKLAVVPVRYSACDNSIEFWVKADRVKAAGNALHALFDY